MPKKKDEGSRAPKGQGAVRQRPDGRWEGRITINGKRRSFYGEKQGEVLKAMRAAAKSADDGVFYEPSKFTVETWCKLWLEEHVRQSVKPHTYTSYLAQIENHIIPGIGKVKLQQLTATQVQAFYNGMAAKGRIMKKSGKGGRKESKSTEVGLSPKTVRNVHGVLHGALKKAVQLRYIGVNVADACTLPRAEKKEIQPLTEEQVKDFLSVIEGDPRFRDLFTVTLFTGMREGEICGLPWDAVDFEKGTITVKQQLSRINQKGADFHIAETKNGRIRTITPAPYVLGVLREVKRKQTENRLKAGRAWSNPWNLVFTDELGNNFIPQTVVKHFKTAATAIGRPDARFHDLRHTFAVMSLQEGDDVKTVQGNLGHATASFTLDVYGHVSERMKQESAARMEGFISRVKNS